MEEDSFQRVPITAGSAQRHQEKPRWIDQVDYCLWWIEEQRAARYDQLQSLLAHESTQQMTELEG